MNSVADHNTQNLSFREAALAKFNTVGFPKKGDELYKYSPITKALKTIKWSEQEDTTDINQYTELPKGLDIQNGYHMVFVNGVFSRKLSTEYKDIPFEAGNLTETFLRENCLENTDPFVQLNSASFKSGFLFKIKDDQKVDKPLIITHFCDRGGYSVKSHVKNMFLLGKKSSLTIIEQFLGTGDYEGFDTAVNHFSLGVEASLTQYTLQAEKNKNHIHVGTTFVRQQKKSVYKNVTISLEGDMIRNNIHVSLEDEYCHADLFGLYSPEGSEHVDNHTTVDHKYPNSTSNELYKGIIGDKATGVFNGSIFVRPNAQNTNAFQSNKNILLTGEATVHAKPQLEIWADDVKCSHGCTSGQIDEESLFYLRARGLSKNQARALLLKAFTTDVTREIEVEYLREYVEKKLEKKLLKDVY